MHSDTFRSITQGASRNQWGLSGLLLAVAVALAQLASRSAVTDAADPQDEVIHLNDRSITESSGLARSHRTDGLFWTHNDSGDTARLVAFDLQGNVVGECRLAGVDPIDLEDMASYVQDGVPRLLLADVGDNRSRRPFVSLYVVDEPDPRAVSQVTRWTRLDLRYPGGARDCEAVAVDADAGLVTLVSKTFLPRASVYEIDLPARHAAADRQPQPQPQKARWAGHLPLSLITAMDRDPGSGDWILVNYFQRFRFSRSSGDQPWWQQTPQASDLPKLRQIEAVAVDANRRVWVTSEGTPMPLARVHEEQP